MEEIIITLQHLLNNESVVDVGGFSGEFSSNVFKIPCKIYIFEPVREYAD